MKDADYPPSPLTSDSNPEPDRHERPPASKTTLQGAPKVLYRAFVFVAGMTVLLVGVVMIVSPGPAIIVIPLGLAILATEFVWAKVLLKRIKQRISGNPPGP